MPRVREVLASLIRLHVLPRWPLRAYRDASSVVTEKAEVESVNAYHTLPESTGKPARWKIVEYGEAEYWESENWHAVYVSFYEGSILRHALVEVR